MWLYGHRNVLRVAIFTLFIVAIIGPWWYDRIVVPSQYPCSSPFIRLRDDYCGEPMSGIWIFVVLAARVFESAVEMVTGATVIIDSVYAFLRIVLYISLALLLVLPLFTTWLLILRGDRNRHQIFHIVAWGLGVLCVIYIFGFNWSWALWGFWLYIGLAVGALLLEILFLFVGIRLIRKRREEMNDQD
jgi:hypothetical protein